MTITSKIIEAYDSVDGVIELTDKNVMLKMPELPHPYHGQAIQAERELLGLLMLHQNPDTVAVEPSWFSSTKHLTIYFAIVGANEKGRQCDVVIVSEILEAAGFLDKVGGVLYLASIAADAPNLLPRQITPLLQGYAMMRYSLREHNGIKVIVTLVEALKNGWLHGKAWKTTQDELKYSGKPHLCSYMSHNSSFWVCYAHLDPAALKKLRRNRKSTVKRN